jgi:hypothetical protein
LGRRIFQYTQSTQGQQTHISLNLVFAFGATMISGGVSVVQLAVLDNAEQL